MSTSPEDKAPNMLSIKYNFGDGTFAELTLPEAKLDKLETPDKNDVLDSAGFMLRAIINGILPKQEDVERFMAIEGASIVLPETHGMIEMQTFLGEQLLTGAQTDLEKY